MNEERLTEEARRSREETQRLREESERKREVEAERPATESITEDFREDDRARLRNRRIRGVGTSFDSPAARRGQ